MGAAKALQRSWQETQTRDEAEGLCIGLGAARGARPRAGASAVTVATGDASRSGPLAAERRRLHEAGRLGGGDRGPGA